MGLDTVELIVSLERFFDVRIADEDAEHIYTLQDAADCIARLREVTATQTRLRDKMLIRMAQVLQLQAPLHPHSPVYLLPDPSNEDAWLALQNGLGLKVPRPTVPADTTLWKRFKNKWDDNVPAYRWQEFNAVHVADTICLCNYKTLTDARMLQDRHEVYIAVAGITLEATGADPYELGAEKSFTTDLGMD